MAETFVREHEFPPPDASSDVCPHCGTTRRQYEASDRNLGCLKRLTVTVRSPVAAVDDFDYIGDRLAELRADRDVAFVRSLEQPANEPEGIAY